MVVRNQFTIISIRKSISWLIFKIKNVSFFWGILVIKGNKIMNIMIVFLHREVNEHILCIQITLGMDRSISILTYLIIASVRRPDSDILHLHWRYAFYARDRLADSHFHCRNALVSQYIIVYLLFFSIIDHRVHKIGLDLVVGHIYSAGKVKPFVFVHKSAV
jgi:hypothetical protein